MSYLVFDIETVGQKFDALDDKTKDILKSWADRNIENDGSKEMDKEMEKIKNGFPLSPYLGEIVTVAVLDHEGKGGVYFQAPSGKVEDFEEDGIKYRVCTEKQILERFWDVARHYLCFVSFNGRRFDVPYLVTRAAIHGVKPTRDMMTNRYVSMQRNVTHIDLQDQLTFYGALYPSPNLHFATSAFGIKSPKTGDIAGSEVPEAFNKKRYKEIAEYCMADVVATRELYEKYKEYYII